MRHARRAHRSAVTYAPDFPFPGDQERTTTRDLSPRPDGNQFAAWVTSRMRVTDRLTSELGLRWDDQSYDDVGGREQIAPRLNLLYDLAPGTRLRAAWGRFWQAQGADELQVEDGIGTFYEPQRADHLILSLEQALPGDLDLRVEAYQKDDDQVRPHFENLFDPIRLMPELEPDRIEVAPDHNPGEEVIVFEPFYENYGPDTILCDAQPRFITLHEPDWHFDEKELVQTFNNKTKAIILNTPNNPTGKVFSRQELQFIADLCLKWGAIAVTDEIYEHILYDGAEHISIASLPGMKELTITINSISKTYSLTGWRVGWAIAPPALTASIRKVHDFLTVGAPHPLQEAAAMALRVDRSYYQTLSREYQERRDFLARALEEAGFKNYLPNGAYYIMTEVGHFGFSDDVMFARHLVEKAGVATVPGSSFYSHPSLGKTKIRFCFPKKRETLQAAAERLKRFK